MRPSEYYAQVSHSASVASGLTRSYEIESHARLEVVGASLTHLFGRSRRHAMARCTTEPEDGGVLVAVRDEGPGISQTEVATLFNPFQCATPRGTAGERSTGLGLAIAKRVMDGHGGRLWCDSELGAGSTFTAWLPQRPAKAR